jgi:hypothetical protein
MDKKALVRIAVRTPSGGKRYPFMAAHRARDLRWRVQQTNHLRDQKALYPFLPMASNAEHNAWHLEAHASYR